MPNNRTHACSAAIHKTVSSSRAGRVFRERPRLLFRNQQIDIGDQPPDFFRTRVN